MQVVLMAALVGLGLHQPAERKLLEGLALIVQSWLVLACLLVQGAALAGLQQARTRCVPSGAVKKSKKCVQGFMSALC